MDTSLAATTRSTETRKGGARKLRAAGRLPAVVYGSGSEGTPVHVDPVAFDTIIRHTRNPNTVFDLDIEGKTVPCLVKHAQRHPLSREILHVDFYSLNKGQEVVVDVPVESTGRAVGASLGGRIRFVRRTLSVACKYTDIPAAIVIDVTPMNIDDVVKVSAIVPPKGCKIAFEDDYIVLACYGKSKALLAEEALEAEEGEEGEEGEAGEAAADEEASE